MTAFKLRRRLLLHNPHKSPFLMGPTHPSTCVPEGHAQDVGMLRPVDALNALIAGSAHRLHTSSKSAQSQCVQHVLHCTCSHWAQDFPRTANYCRTLPGLLSDTQQRYKRQARHNTVSDIRCSTSSLQMRTCGMSRVTTMMLGLMSGRPCSSRRRRISCSSARTWSRMYTTWGPKDRT